MGNVDLSVQVGGVRLRNPVLTASGTFGYGLEFQPFMDVASLGGICTKGLSLEPRVGNDAPRIRETPSGMLNAIGLANVGVEAFCQEKLPLLRERGITVIANIFATTVEDFVTLARRLDRETGVAALELNVSCPNVDKGGIEFGRDARAAHAVTRACKDATSLPVWVKLSPEAGDIVAVAKACADAGADALTAINTIRGMSIDLHTQKPHLANRTGGLSGPAIKPLALRIVWEVCRAVPLPMIGIGGIACTEDAIEFLLAGACAIQVGTASFARPQVAREILEGIEAYCQAHRTSPAELIGKAR